MPLCPTFEARLVRSRELTPSVRELVFERVDGQAMAFEPGQWVRVRLPIVDDATRAYSMASAPDGSPQFELAVTRVEGGIGSAWLHAAQPGDVLSFDGPQGFFTRPSHSPPPSLMIATGTGVAPLRSLLRASVASGAVAPMWLVLGVRREQDILYGAEFRRLAERHAFVRFEPTLSQGSAEWAGRRGYVQTHVRALWEELAVRCGEQPHVYVCGLERMVGSVRRILRKEMGLPRERVHSERYD